MLDFSRFKNGTLFLIRTPETFPDGYAEEAFADMKRLHFDYAAWLETWNCLDGIVWLHPDYPRSSYWQGCPRDPLEETFLAADRAGMAFLPECGVIHDAFVEANPDAKWYSFDGENARYGRLGLSPAAPITADFAIAKYEALVGKFGGHPSLQGLCMPAENGVCLSYDRYTEQAYREQFGSALPSPEELRASPALRAKTNDFLEGLFLQMYRRIARHLKQKFHLPLMHYPLSMISCVGHHEPHGYTLSRNLELITQVEELDLLNLQVHPPLGNHPRQFKLEIELLQALTRHPVVADTHWYHETNAGKLPELTPKRAIDWILSTLSPWGVSFFCYGFMAKELPPWNKELNPGAPVFRCYSNPDTLAGRRKAVVRGMDFASQIGVVLEGTRQYAQCAIFYRENLERDYCYTSYYREHLFSLYESLQAAALPTMFTAQIPEDATHITCLVFDAVKHFDDADAVRLRAFLSRGGKAVVLGICASTLLEACGLTTVRECEAEYVTTSGSPDDAWFFPVPVDGRKHTCKGETLLAYSTGAGAVVRQGNVIFIGCWTAVSGFENYRHQGVVAMWKQLFHNLLKADSGVEFHGDHRGHVGEHEYVSCDLFASADGKRRVLLLRDFGVEVVHSRLRWTLPDGFGIVSKVIDGKEVALPASGELPLFEYYVLLEARQYPNERLSSRETTP